MHLPQLQILCRVVRNRTRKRRRCRKERNRSRSEEDADDAKGRNRTSKRRKKLEIEEVVVKIADCQKKEVVLKRFHMLFSFRARRYSIVLLSCFRCFIFSCLVLFSNGRKRSRRKTRSKWSNGDQIQNFSRSSGWCCCKLC